MKSIISTSYQLVETLEPQLDSLLLSNEIYDTPYTKIIDPSKIDDSLYNPIYSAEDIAFVNTNEFSKTGNFFLQNGIYTNAHPVFDKQEYTEFWDREEQRRKEGLILPGKLVQENGIWKLQEVHITGQHYGYLNFGEIKRSKGFETEKGVLFSPNGERISRENKSRGGTKKTRLLPSFWDGDYYFFKAYELIREINKHLVVGKARRKGYSYKNGFLVADLADLYPFSTSVVGAYDELTLTDDGIMTKVQMYLDFLAKHTDWAKRRLHNTLRHIEIGYRFAGDPTKRGHLSNIYTAVLQKDPGGLRGKDSDLILIEEGGKVSNLGDVITPTLKTLEDGIYVTGNMIVFGTGGGDDKYWKDFEDLFYNLYGNKFVAFENIYDEDLKGTGCGFFHPSYMSKPGYIDRHGNSNIKDTVIYEEKERKILEPTPVKYNAYIMEEPFKPSEAFSRSGNSIMPIQELDAQLKRLSFDPDFKGIGREGIFVREPNGIKFYDRAFLGHNTDLIPPVVEDFPIKPNTDLRGCWVMWEPPYRDPKTGLIPDNLYRLWNDPFGISKDSDEFTYKESLGCCYIYEVANNFTPTKGDRIVGEFVGRREDLEDYDLQMFLGASYYNASILYENDRGEVYSNAKKLGYLDLLIDEPEFVYQKDLQGGGKGRKKGISIATNANRKINGAIYYKNWLTIKRGVDSNGKELLNLHYIYSKGLLKETIKYGQGNTDRVSTMIIGQFDVREMMHKEIVPETYNTSYTEDSYFN